MDSLTANAKIFIQAPVEKVWQALVDPELIKQYMFGTSVASEWKQGSSITWKGEWQGKAYEDKGRILQLSPNKMLQYTHFSPLTGKADAPENYHTVTIGLESRGTATNLILSQDNNDNETDRQHAQKNWMTMLLSLKNLLEEKDA
jgi:uncharacterized protein YndB with AHSA1/START domain